MKTERGIRRKLASVTKKYQCAHGSADIAETWGWTKALKWVLGE